MRRDLMLLPLVVGALVAGCVTAGEPELADEESPDDVWIPGIVIDPELVPIAGVFVSADGLQGATTGDDGLFHLGPAAPGTYLLLAERAGYAPQAVSVTVGTDVVGRVVVRLVPVAADVPYFETVPYSSIIGCAVSTPTTRMTCGFIAQATGIEPVEDSSVLLFSIPNDGLAMLVIETTWQPATAFANVMSVNVLDQEGDQSNCITTACYAEQVGEPPIRLELVPGMKWQDTDFVAAFPGEQGHGFVVYLVPPFGTADYPFLFYLDQRADTYLSFFYNRPASGDFSALPDG
jgi:hypothetical protein